MLEGEVLQGSLPFVKFFSSLNTDRDLVHNIPPSTTKVATKVASNRVFQNFGGEQALARFTSILYERENFNSLSEAKL